MTRKRKISIFEQPHRFSDGETQTDRQTERERERDICRWDIDLQDPFFIYLNSQATFVDGKVLIEV